MSDTIGHLRSIISADSKPFETGVNKSKRAIKSFGKSTEAMGAQLKRLSNGLLAAAGAAGFGALTHAAITSADAIGKTSAKLGIATDALQKLHFAGEQSGVGIRTMNMGLQRMTRRISEAAAGTGEAKAAIAELGLSAQRLNSLSPDQAFLRIADALKEVGNQSDRVRLTNKLFDSEGVALVALLQKGSEETQRFGRELQQLGGVISSAAIAQIEALKDKFNAFKLVLTAKVAEGLSVFGDTIISLVGTITQSISAVVSFTKYINDITGGFAGLVVKAGLVVGVWGGLLLGIKAGIGAIWKSTKAIAAKTKALVFNNGQLKVNTALTKQNAAAQLASSKNYAWAVGMGKSSRLDYSKKAPAAWSQLPGTFGKIRNAGTKAFAAVGASLGPITIGIGAALAAAHELWNFFTGKQEKTIGYSLGESAFNFVKSARLENNEKDWQQHIENCKKAEQAEQARANAIAETNRKLKEQAERLKKAKDDAMTGIYSSLEDRLMALEKNPAEMRDIRKLETALAGSSQKELNDAIAGLQREYVFVRGKEALSEYEKKVTSFIETANNVGKTQFEIDLEKMHELMGQAAPEDKGLWKELIKQFTEAKEGLDAFNKSKEESARIDKERADAVSEFGSKYSQLESLRNKSGGTRSVGAYDAGSLGAYRAIRNADLGLANLKNLHQQEISLLGELKKILQTLDMTTKEMSDKLDQNVSLA